MNNSLDRRITMPSLLKFTLPSIVMMVVMSLYTVVDGMFVSRLLNTDAFSAVNIIYPLLSLVIALGTMFGTGATAIVTRKLGEGKQLEANQNITFLVLFTIVLGIIISIVSFAFLDKIIYLLGADDIIYGYCYAYAFPLIFFLPANILQLQFQSLFAANGKPAIGLVTTVLGGLANVFLDYYFIAVCGMGISGAAIATGIGYCVPALYGLYYFTYSKKANFYFVKPKINWLVLKNTVINGSSEMVTNLSTSITTFLFNIMMMRYFGSDGVAAISILLYLDFVLVAINLGYSIGAAPLIGYNYGRLDTSKIKKIYKNSVVFCMAIGIFMTLFTVLFSRQLASIFAKEGTVVYNLAVTGLKIYAYGYLFKGFNIFSSALFTAFSDGKVSAILSFLRTLVFLTASLFGLTVLFGVNGIWFASPVAEALAFSVSIYYTIKYRKKYHYI